MLLEDVLKHRTVQAADPLLRAAPDSVPGRQVRWVHSSEVLDIAPLLRGGELLLSGGQALATASDKRQVDYVRELAGRGVAALAIETGPTLPDIPESMLIAAESNGLPLFELRKVAPFVGIMQEINSILVGQSVELLQRGDEISHAMAAELAHGGGLDEVLAVLAGQTGTSVRLVSPAGLTLGSAGADGGGSAGGTGTGGLATASTTAVDVPVRGVLAARLELEAPEGIDPAFVRVAGERSVDILGLALLQRMPPGLKELAGAELMRAVHSGAQPWRLEQLGAAAGFAVDGPVAAVMIRSAASGRLRPALDRILADSVPHAASYADKLELIALAGLPPEGTRAARASLIEVLGNLDVPEGSAIAVGPLGQGVGEAAWSMAEARRTLDLAPRTGRAASGPRQVRDADAFSAERLAAESIDGGARRDFVRRTLGPVLEHDEQRNSQLLHTLTVWLDSGCNTAQAARELHLERQSMYHRLQRIFDLCGGDPRGTGRLAGLHLATRLAPLP
ncbi:putative CdaR family transcriptional regulator [Arthrobacter globiformis NBRC 12137]|uniref:Putative CdaR family transcriptional regulator n=1 Tax=Arthrobacter globiformis (strain ATCC 8010 / DSM 20124 / JCM 1332 / NBRC 12137 / NCIMB 8907 / NRRL B-2979 / 168) TaxID=1077972 RepID=H0QQ84_ARTG1|nr:PucR family transcriptional regulator [Arthrobacter globiformis]GAB14985.1 putative CdaR family transcriptional regulator [Arthrobacter globiformis NBRC 12137]